MNGKARDELDLEQLNKLSQERNFQHQLTIREDTNSKLDEITRNWNTPPDDTTTKPYGVQYEGEAYDVWSLILEKIIDPSEVKKVWNVSNMFRNILRQKYIQTRLPELVNLILDQYTEYLVPADTADFAGYMREERAKTSNFVNLRLLSRQCKRSLEDITSSKESEYLYLTTAEQVAGILETLREKPSYAASFFPNYIVIREESVRNNLEAFQREITNLLKLVGHRIAFFIYLSYLDMKMDIYTCARTWAGFMPNLKSLKLVQEVIPMNDEPIPRLEDVERFPSLPLLQSYEGGDMFAPCVHRILEASHGIADLQLHQYFKQREHLPHALESTRNLTSLRMNPYPSLLRDQHLPWKLNKLVLCCYGYVDGGSLRTTISSCKLFSFLKQFEETLEYLKLDRVDVTDCCGYLELKNLKTIKMELHESFENLNFLLPAGKLETLHVRIGKRFKEDLPPSEKFRKVIRESFLGKSVWDIFPYLKLFQLCTSSYMKLRPGFGHLGEIFEEFRPRQHL